jgi:hypothetical protein
MTRRSGDIIETIEVVNGRLYFVSLLFARANGVDFMADHQEHLEGDHRFIIFGVIPRKKENFFPGHSFKVLIPDLKLALIPREWRLPF